ncbi:MAG: glycerate kinase [Planctomycetia bacterium]
MNASALLRDDARAIWMAAIDAVRPDRLVAEHAASHDLLAACDGCKRIVVVGAGKAAAGMAAGVEAALGAQRIVRHRVTGLVSVPEGCGRALSAIEVRETRPAGLNLPTPRVVEATLDMLDLVSSLEPGDIVIAVITGGGSALLAAPRPGITLEEKIAVTTRLSESGASIAELNAARRTMSRVKGGGLARACTAGRLIVLVLSDVIGDDLDVIASGPCMPSEPGSDGCWRTDTGCHVRHLILGDNATAVTAARDEASRRGYEIIPATIPAEAAAEIVGSRLASEGVEAVARAARDGRPRAIIGGGEATVRVPADHGTGGRNQQTVLAAIDTLRRSGSPWPVGLLVASMGTDGEDGPTDAAGALADARLVAEIEARRLDVSSAVARCDAYPFFDAVGGLIRTGQTGTNVADLRLALARGEAPDAALA